MRHLKEKEILEQSLPSLIVIGPFTVNVEAVRKSLSNKRRALANAVIERLALKLRKQTEEASFTGFDLKRKCIFSHLNDYVVCFRHVKSAR